MGSGSPGNLNMGEASGFKLLKLFNSLGAGPPPDPLPKNFLFKLFNSQPELNNLNMGETSGFKLFNSRPQLNNLNILNNLNSFK